MIMKRSAVLTTLALVLATTSISIAQPTTGFSVNAIGVVNVTVPAGGYAILSNPLNGTPDNNLNTVLPLPDEYIGANVYRFNATSQRYYGTMTWLGAGSGGWLS